MPPTKYDLAVTQEDIDRGWRNNFERCPVAIAIRRAISDLFMCGVGCLEIDLFFVSGEKAKIVSPIIVCAFVDDYDNRREVSPFSFTLEVDLVQANLIPA